MLLSWCEYFTTPEYLQGLVYLTHRDEYFEYLLGNMGYMGEEMFIMHMIRRQELPPNVDHDVVWAYKKMHARLKVQIEWGMGWRESGGALWKILIQQNQSIHICFKL
jgi:hypothetical protein